MYLEGIWSVVYYRVFIVYLGPPWLNGERRRAWNRVARVRFLRDENFHKKFSSHGSEIFSNFALKVYAGGIPSH